MAENWFLVVWGKLGVVFCFGGFSGVCVVFLNWFEFKDGIQKTS